MGIGRINMGLALSVDGKTCARWSYSGFDSFRSKVAEECGIELRKMEGFPDFDKTKMYKDGVYQTGGYEAYRDAIFADAKKTKISWDTINDPIKHLLYHSDCDGEIAPEFCGIIADRLEEVIISWPEELVAKSTNPEQSVSMGYPAEMTFDNYDKVQARGLIEGLRKAVKLNVPLEFH